MIALQKLMKIYQMGDSTVHALDGVSLFIGQGEFVAITGPSGSGKSTLMNILGCLDRPTSGSYQLDGAEVATLNDDQLALTRNKKIGFVFQNFNLLPRISALHNIALPLVYAGVAEKERLDRSLTVLTKVGLAERRDHRPNELSGGQRQRVYISRALAAEPKILLLDEPTSSVDSQSSNQLYDLLAELNDHIAILLISHDLTAISTYVKTIGCVNRQLIYQGSKELTPEMVETGYGCPVDLIAHGLPHRVIAGHQHEDRHD